MSNIDLVKQILDDGRATDFTTLEKLTADDMKFDGPVPEPVGKKEFIGLMQALTTAMPDWRYNPRNYAENGNKVTATIQITGTQTGTLALPMLPQAYPASGKHVQLPQEHLEITLTNNKISRIHSDTVPGAGVMGILEQLGVKLPVH